MHNKLVGRRKTAWEKVCKEFPDDPMLRDLHFIRELMEMGMTPEEINRFFQEGKETGAKLAFREVIENMKSAPQDFLPLKERKIKKP